MAEQCLLELREAASTAAFYQTFVARVAFPRANPPVRHWDGAFAFQADTQ